MTNKILNMIRSPEPRPANWHELATKTIDSMAVEVKESVKQFAKDDGPLRVRGMINALGELQRRLYQLPQN